MKHVMSNCIPCSPCENNCPDDGTIIEAELLPADECSGPCGGCCGKKCNDNCGINIQSTNECLEVDTSECGVVKLTSHCPPKVTAGDNITVEAKPCEDENCSINYVVSADCEDEKVKACSGDSTPGYLNQKLEAGNGITIDEVNCGGGGNAYLKIGIDEGIIPDIPEIPDVKVNYDGDLLKITQAGDHNHIINISDNTTGSFYDNTAMIGFFSNKDYTNVKIDGDGNQEKAIWIENGDVGGGWDMCTGNTKLATQNGIKIKQSGYYYIYGQLTVCLNYYDANRYANLGRALIKISNTERKYLGDTFSLTTAKHGAHGTYIAAKGGNGINIAQDGTISINRGRVTTSEGGGTYEVTFDAGGGMQPTSGFDGPWATLNVGCLVDLYAGEVITLGYRCQSDIPQAESQTTSFRIVGVNDSSTEYKSLFGGTCLGVIPITPTLFQSKHVTKIYEGITQ